MILVHCPFNSNYTFNKKDISASDAANDSCSGDISTLSFLLSDRLSMMTDTMWTARLVSICK